MRTAARPGESWGSAWLRDRVCASCPPRVSGQGVPVGCAARLGEAGEASGGSRELKVLAPCSSGARGRRRGRNEATAAGARARARRAEAGGAGTAQGQNHDRSGRLADRQVNAPPWLADARPPIRPQAQRRASRPDRSGARPSAMRQPRRVESVMPRPIRCRRP